MAFEFRPATTADLPAIDVVHRAAFPTDLEARLVALLIARGKATISVVAETEGRVVGHILFSPATHSSPHAPREEPIPKSEMTSMHGLGLAPVAVLPAFQNQGLGSALVRAGLDQCCALATPWVVVLGHETYYPRFGFAPARNWNLTCDYGDSDAFQFLPLTPAADSIRGGHIRYANEFAELFPS
jgi:putative acetyltransferase